MTEKEKLGLFVKKIREKVPSREYDKEHISQQELADSNLGLTKNFIGSVERGNANPSLDKLILLAKSLNQKKVNILNCEIDVEKYILEYLSKRK